MMYDVVVVGAGPAGATFVKSLAEEGQNLKILLIDGQNEKNKKVCGGLLAPDAQEVLAKFGLTLPKSILEDPQIFAVDTVDLVSGENRCYKRHYLNMDRYAFDKWLLSLVPDRVKVVQARCVSVRQTGEYYRLKLQSACGVQHINAASVVGADGAASVVRRNLFGKLPYQYVSIQKWYETDGDIPPYSCIFDAKTSDSCSWTIRKGKYAVFGGAYKLQGCRRAFEEQRERFEKSIGQSLGQLVKTEACLLTSPRKFSDFVTGKDCAYLAGEAAGFISASSFEGISSAMLCGKLLAEAFAQGSSHRQIQMLYRKKTLLLRLKLLTKIFKMYILCSPFLRFLIMKSGVQSMKKYDAISKKTVKGGGLMELKRVIYRLLWGVTMAASATVYLFLVPELLRFPFQTWNWPMLVVLLLAEFEIFEGIDYFISNRAFRKPKLCKRMNIACGGIIVVGLVLMFLDAVWHFIEPDLFGLYFLMFLALCLILFGHGVNCFFDGLNYFLHEQHKRWYKTTWNVTKMAAVVLVVLLVTLLVIWAFFQ